MKRKNQSVCDLNAEAVRFLEEGDNSSAVQNLEIAIDRLRARLYQSGSSSSDKAEQESHPPCEIESQNDDDTNHPPHKCGQQPLYSVPIALPDSDPTKDSTDNLFVFYSRVFVFAERNQGPPMREFVVLLYNLALAHHEEGIHKNTPSLLEDSLEFYEMAVDIMKSLSQQMDDYDLLLLLAVVNNMGHIHSHLLNFQETREKVELVKRLTAVANKRRNQSTTGSETEYSFFFQAAVSHDGRELSAAPAA